MHFMVSFEVDAPPEQQPSVMDELRLCFLPHRHVEAIRGAYVVQVMGYGVYEDVQKKLLAAARRHDEVVVRFVMTPLQQRGLYHGRMRQEAADVINTLTD